MFEYLIFIFLGIFFGIVAGLVPGIHPNMIALIFSSLLFKIFPDSISFICFIVSLGVCNSFVSAIPSILFGAPDSEDSLAVLPGHRLLMKGFAYFAIKLTVIGSLFGFLFCLLCFPILYYFIPIIYNFVSSQMHLFLLTIVFLLILTERGIRNKILATFIFLISGILGIAGNSLPISQNYYLFCLFTGLFGMPVLLLSIKNNAKIPEQKFHDKKISVKSINRAIISGSFAGTLTGIFPGVSASHATIISNLTNKSNDRFLISLGSATTTNIIFSFLSLFLIGKGRSGLAVIIKNFVNIGTKEFFLIIFVSIISLGIASLVTLKISKILIKQIEKINYNLLNKITLLFLFFLVFLFAGFWGLMLSFISLSLGIFVNLNKIKRTHMMGSIMLPVILFYMKRNI
jgi:putative membrane protein